MPHTGAASLTIAEMREFASFAQAEQLYIERALDIGLGRRDAFKLWSRATADDIEIRSQYLAYRELRGLRAHVPAALAAERLDDFLAPLIRISAQDLARDRLHGFSAYRFLYERLLGAKARPWLPAAFCAAASLPLIRPVRRKQLLQSLSEAAAMAAAWSDREPIFYPEKVEVEAA